MLVNQTKLKENQEKLLKIPDDELFYNKEICPICGSDDLQVEGRCTTCQNCGWSKCSI